MQRIARFIEQNAKHFEISQGEKRKSLLARFCLALRLGTPLRLPRRNGVRLRRGLSCSAKPLRFLLSAPLRMTQGGLCKHTDKPQIVAPCSRVLVGMNGASRTSPPTGLCNPTAKPQFVAFQILIYRAPCSRRPHSGLPLRGKGDRLRWMR